MSWYILKMADINFGLELFLLYVILRGSDQNHLLGYRLHV